MAANLLQGGQTVRMRSPACADRLLVTRGGLR